MKPKRTHPVVTYATSFLKKSNLKTKNFEEQLILKYQNRTSLSDSITPNEKKEIEETINKHKFLFRLKGNYNTQDYLIKKIGEGTFLTSWLKEFHGKYELGYEQLVDNMELHDFKKIDVEEIVHLITSKENERYSALLKNSFEKDIQLNLHETIRKYNKGFKDFESEETIERFLNQEKILLEKSLKNQKITDKNKNILIEKFVQFTADEDIGLSPKPKISQVLNELVIKIGSLLRDWNL